MTLSGGNIEDKMLFSEKELMYTYLTPILTYSTRVNKYYVHTTFRFLRKYMYG
jgi:hypothetical protein